MRAFIALLVGFAGLALGQTRHVVVISHRGEHLHHPENTMPAFRAAFEAGADFIEVDVRTTSDGKLILMHNDTVDARTNGTGAVKDMTFDQIRALDAGAKSGPSSPEPKRRPSMKRSRSPAERSASMSTPSARRPPISWPRSNATTCRITS